MPLEAFVTVKYLNGFLSKLEEKKKKYENTHTHTNQPEWGKDNWGKRMNSIEQKLLL